MVRVLKLFGTVYQVVGMGFVLLAIPLAFDVGGADCGLSFTFLLSAFYFLLSSFRLAFRRTFLQPVASLLYYTQYIVIPSLLIMHLSQCPVTSPWLNKLMWPWRVGLDNATGAFTIFEGFCTLIIVQACGRASVAMAKRSDLFLLVQLAAASLLITMDIYLLLRIYTFPDIIGLASATLIGAALSTCLSLGVYGIWSRKGNVVECTLLFSYIVYQIYLTFTDFQRDLPGVGFLRGLIGAAGSEAHMAAAASMDPGESWRLWSLFTPLSSNTRAPDPLWPTHLLEEIEVPPVLIANVTQFMTTLAELTPTGLKTMFRFLRAVTSSITPSIFMSLAWRMFSYLGALRLVPYIKRQTPKHSLRLSENTTYPKKPSRLVMLIYSYSPILIIMVYTHLLLQHAGRIVHVSHVKDPLVSSPDVLEAAVSGFDWSRIWTNSREAWQFWGWANVFVVLAFYSIELGMSPADQAPATPVVVADDVIEMN